MKEYEEFKVCKDCHVLDFMDCPIAAERQENIHTYNIYKDLRHCKTKLIINKMIEFKSRRSDEECL